MSHFEHLRKLLSTTRFRLLVLCSVLFFQPAMASSELCAAVLETQPDDQFSSIVRDAETARTDDLATNELLDLELRAVHLLRQAPHVFFDAIGANFGVYTTKQHLAQDAKASRHCPEISRREIILKHASCSMTADEWDHVSDYFADTDLMQFFATTLTRLKASPPGIIYELRPGQHAMLTNLFLQKIKPEMPSAFELLEYSEEFRRAFLPTARAKKKGLKISLASPAARKAAAKMIENRELGNPYLFMHHWLMNEFLSAQQTNLEYDLPHTLGEFIEYMSQPTDKLVQEFRAMRTGEYEITNSRVFNFTVRYHTFIALRSQWYLASEIRQAMIDGLKEHHHLLMDLLGHTQKTAEEVPDDSVREWVEHRRKDVAEPQPVVPLGATINLDLFISGQLPISQLSADKTYHIVFKRDFGLRKKVYLVRFTARALSELTKRQLKTVDQFPPTVWLEALQMGFAAQHGARGIKLLRQSPLEDIPQLNMEIKILHSPWRWLGVRDDAGNYTLDLFHNDHR